MLVHMLAYLCTSLACLFVYHASWNLVLIRKADFADQGNTGLTRIQGSEDPSKGLAVRTQARYVAAVKLMLACGTTACAPRVVSEYSFTDLVRMNSWFAVGLACLACGL